MNTTQSPQTIPLTLEGISAPIDDLPRLSQRQLTWALIFMCLIPITTLAALWGYLPEVHVGKLNASIAAEGLPNSDYYAIHYRLRQPHQGGELVVTNHGEQDWTHLNIQINSYYQIYDIEPIKAGQTRRYVLDRFLNRGARFSLQYNQLKSARVYARLPTRDRATFERDFATVPEG